jgi:signal transduction histidine kinase
VRRRLALQAAAVSAMIALAFLIPLGILVGELAADRALTRAERDAESVARFVAVLSPSRGLDGALEALRSDRLLDSNVSLIGSDGDVIGAPVPPDEDLTGARDGVAFRAEVDGGQAVYVPLVQSDSKTAVVRVFVPDADLSEGVGRSLFTLGALGLVLSMLAVLLFDSLGRSVLKAVTNLYDTTERIGRGDVGARASPAGPDEIATVGEGLNRLAARIDGLLQEERETAANLSHRLRTPLAAARLSAEGIEDDGLREQLLSDLDRLDRTVDHIISEVRRPGRTDEAQVFDFDALLAERVEFWKALADDQGRQIDVTRPGRPVIVRLPPADAAAMIDALLVNAIAHTPAETPMAVSLFADGDHGIVLAVEDAGPGFRDAGVLERGRSDGQSTGLGLDIVGETTRSAGGEMKIGSSRRLGGAMVVVRLPLHRPGRDRDRSVRRHRRNG